MRVSLVAYEDLDRGDFVSITEGVAGRVQKTKITGNFNEANSIGVVQFSTQAGNVVVVVTDGPTITQVYRGQLIAGREYYVGLDSQPVLWDELRDLEGFMQTAGFAGSTDQLCVDLHPPIYIVPASLT